jgi:hypothetical protein
LINQQVTLEETRLKMIASSPLYFCERLPRTQMHFGEKDDITPAAQGQLLFDAMNNRGLQDKIALFIYPNRGHSDIAQDNHEMEQCIRNFFDEL